MVQKRFQQNQKHAVILKTSPHTMLSAFVFAIHGGSHQEVCHKKTGTPKKFENVLLK